MQGATMRTWILAAALVAACTVVRPVGAGVKVPPETAQECDTACASMGMVMSAVVLVSNRAGCVCERTPQTTPRAAGASATAAGVIIAISDEEAAQATQLRDQQKQQNHRH